MRCDGSSYNDVIRTAIYRLARCHHSFLIIGAPPRRTHTWHDKRRLFAGLSPQRLHFVGARDKSVDAARQPKLRQPRHLFRNGQCKAAFTQRFVSRARQYRHA